MRNLIKLISNKFNLIKPKKYEKNIYTIFAQRKLVIEKANTETIDTELTIELPENCTVFLATKFEGQDIQKFIGPCRKRLWLTILNQSYTEKYQINKGDLIGYLLLEPDNLNVHYIAKEKTSCWQKMTKCPNIISPKIGRSIGKTTSKKRGKRSQTGSFLNRYDFAYAGRDTVNQVVKSLQKL